MTAPGTAGFAYVGARNTWINGYLDQRVTVREQGHNYGLNHANSNFCTNADLGAGCSFKEYGDPYDAMGNAFDDVGHFNAYEKDRLDWFDDRTPAADLTAGGSLTLIPLEVRDNRRTRDRGVRVNLAHLLAGIPATHRLRQRAAHRGDNWRAGPQG